MPPCGSFKETVIHCDPVRSLCWDNGSLIDVAGGSRFDLDGARRSRSAPFGAEFNRFTSLRTGAEVWGVLYENHGSRALLLRNGELAREIDRAPGAAEECDFPVALAQLPSGKPALLHCPEKGNELEIDDVETGVRMTPRRAKAMDFLHGRLEVSPGGRYVVSLGLRWQSWRTALVFDLRRALEDPATLNGPGLMKAAEPQHQIESATFSGPETLVVAAVDEVDIERRTELLVWDLESKTRTARHFYHEPLGRLFASGRQAFSLYPYPKRIDLVTGEVVQRWPHLSLAGSDVPAAFDRDTCSVAIATPEGLTVLQAA